MIELTTSRSRATQAQGLTRRSLLKAGYLGLAGLSLADLLRIEAKAKENSTAQGKELSIILVWLDGGPPQHETYDPKPDAPIEFRGPLKPISTSVPGVAISELLPEHARHMDKMAIIRSMHHHTGDHFAAAHWMLTGVLGSTSLNLAPQNPSAGAIIAKLKGAKRPGLPAYVGLPNTHSVGLAPGYHGGAYLGLAYNPFSADGDPNSDNYQVPNLTPPSGVDLPRLTERRSLLQAFDQVRRDVDASGVMEGIDRFGQDAYAMVSSPATRSAFDIRKESPRLRDRYGRNTWGQSALVARRLVQAGVRFVTLTYGGWDYHSSLEVGMKRVLPQLDQAVGTLIDDLAMRGLLETTIVLVMGEFGRTPRINQGLPGIDPVPGRDHWGDLMSVLVAGGGFTPGRVVGTSNSRGEVPKDCPITPPDLLVTLYHQMGIDPATTFHDRSGRPIPIGSTGRVIHELF